MVGMQHDFTFFIIPIGMNLKCIFFDGAPWNVGVVVGKVYWNFSDIENAAQLFYDPIFPVFSLARSLAGSSVKLKKSKVCLMIIKKKWIWMNILREDAHCISVEKKMKKTPQQ